MKLIKWLLWLVLFLVVVAIGAAVFLVTKVDPNEFKPQISQQVESLTGRKLNLKGDLEWRFYPWVGVTLNDFSLSNREGFAPDNMLEAAQVDVQLKLLPLISKQLEIGNIVLQSPKISLSLNEQGETNWDDLASKGGATAPVIDKPEQAAGAMLGGLVVQGVDISQGDISWNDQTTNQNYRLENFNLSTGTIEPGTPVTFEMNTGLSGTDLSGSAQIQTKGALLLNETMDAVRLEGLSTQLNMDGTEAKLELTSLDFTLRSGMLNIKSLSSEVSMEQVSAKASIAALSYALESQIASVIKLRYSGQYDIYPFEGEVAELAFDASNNVLNLSGHKASLEYNEVPVAVSGTGLRVDLDKETLESPELNIQLDDAKLNINLQLNGLMSDIKASGHLLSNTFNPRELADKLGVDVLDDMPDKAMQSLTLEADFSGGMSSVGLENMVIKLDESNLAGRFSMQDFAQPAYRFNLQLDEINVDDYTGEASSSEAKQEVARDAATDSKAVSENIGASGTSPQTSGPASALAALPFEELKGLDIQGEIAIGVLRMQNLLSNDVLVKVGAEADRIEISPLRAQIYGGEALNTVVYDVSGTVPSVDISSELLSLDMGSFLQAMDISDRFDGFGTVIANLSSSGLMVDEVVSNLNGEIDIQLSDGAIRGVDLQASLIKAEALVQKLSGQETGLSADLGDKTEFSDFRSDIKIEQGVMMVRSINLQAPAIRVAGGGTVDLNTEQLDLKLDVSIVGSFEGQGGETLDKLKGQTIPMKITGSLESPSVLPDFSKIFQKELERKLTEKYLGEGASGESFNDALNRTLDAKIAEELGQDQPATTDSSVENTTDPKPADSTPEETDEEPLSDKQKLRKELKKEGAKLLQGLFGS